MTKLNDSNSSPHVYYTICPVLVASNIAVEFGWLDEEFKRVGPEGGNHGAERGGHIPGAVLLPFAGLLDEHSRLRPVDELRALVAAKGIEAQRETAVYCRLSHRSTLAFFVLAELLGFANVRVYDGSWTEWGSLVGAPIEA